MDFFFFRFFDFFFRCAFSSLALRLPRLADALACFRLRLASRSEPSESESESDCSEALASLSRLRPLRPRLLLWRRCFRFLAPAEAEEPDEAELPVLLRAPKVGSRLGLAGPAAPSGGPPRAADGAAPVGG